MTEFEKTMLLRMDEMVDRLTDLTQILGRLNSKMPDYKKIMETDLTEEDFKVMRVNK